MDESIPTQLTHFARRGRRQPMPRLPKQGPMWTPFAPVLFICLATAPAPAADDKPVNLLRHKSVRLERVNLPPNDQAPCKALNDDKTDTFLIAAAEPDAPLEVVYSFGGA